MYVTPVAGNEICLALITRYSGVRFEEGFDYFPALAARLRDIAPERDYLGAVTTTRNFAAVRCGNAALVGEASGSVDAVTGEGLSMAFRQGMELAAALRAGDLRQYEVAHRRIARGPRMMSTLMLAMDRYPGLRRRAFRALAAEPANFGRMLAIHTGELAAADFGVRSGIVFGWNLIAG
jgi:flavin-dependent dehydrogenase